jgi:putative transposase
MDGRTSFDEFRMSDKMWNRLEPLLPKYERSHKGGRSRANLRDIADAIFFRMRVGCQWKAIPPALAPGSTAHGYFQEWVQAGIFDDLWQLAIAEYDELVGLDLKWQSVDGAMTKAPLGGELTGKNPTDRGKLGTKRSLMVDAAGIPIGLVVNGANAHDVTLLKETIDNCVERISGMSEESTEHLCLDKAYDSRVIKDLVQTVYGYVTHIRSRGEEQRELNKAKGERPRRWVVERTHGWLNRFRAVLVRWEKKVENHIAALHLACAYYTLKRAAVFG